MDLTRNFTLVISNLIMFFVLFFALKPALLGKFKQYNIIWILLLIIIFCVCSFWGPDWFHYYETYILLKDMPELPSQLEPFYRDLIEWTPNYWYFRLLIWGGGILLTFCAFKILNLDMGVALFYFVICSLIWYSYGRVSLAFAFSMFGFSLFIAKKRILICRPLGIFFILLSILFHKSAIFMVIIICITIIFARMRIKKGVSLLLFIFPLFAVLLPMLIGQFLNIEIGDDSELMQTVTYGQRYLSGGTTGLHFGSLGKIPSKILEWIPKYIVAYICYKYIISNNDRKDSTIYYFCVMTFLIIFSSTFFAFDLGYSSGTVFSRFQRFAILPEVVVMTSFYNNDCYRELMRKAQFLFAFSSFYTLIYQTYCVF